MSSLTKTDLSSTSDSAMISTAKLFLSAICARLAVIKQEKPYPVPDEQSPAIHLADDPRQICRGGSSPHAAGGWRGLSLSITACCAIESIVLENPMSRALCHVNRLVLPALLLLGSACSSTQPRPALASLGNLQHGLPEFIKIEGNTFLMGNAGVDPESPDFFPDEMPLEVTVEDFEIARTVVTADQYCEFLNSPEVADELLDDYYRLDRAGEHKWSSITYEDGRYVPRAGAADAPADRVTWLGAMRYCQWLSERTGQRYRLPIEAEWEYAARGKEGRQWPWGNQDPYVEQERKWWHLFEPQKMPDPSRCALGDATVDRRAMAAGFRDRLPGWRDTAGRARTLERLRWGVVPERLLREPDVSAGQ